MIVKNASAAAKATCRFVFTTESSATVFASAAWARRAHAAAATIGWSGGQRLRCI